MRNTLWDDFKRFILYSTNSLNHLLAINVAVFLVFGLMFVFLDLFDLNKALYALIFEYTALPSNPERLLFRPWTFISYQFLHREFFHIFFNLLILYFSGRIFREFLGDTKLVTTYLIGGFLGGLFYIAALQLIPKFNNIQDIGSLEGASAGVMAVLVAIGTLLPNYTVSLILIGPVRLIYIVVVFVIIDLLSLSGVNAGGHFAHLGGVLWGFSYIKALQNGYDPGNWLSVILQKIKNINFKRRQKPTMRYYVNTENMQPQARAGFSMPSKVTQEEVDRILEKILDSGYDSLTQKEKDVLFKASQES